MTRRRDLAALLATGPRTASSVARALGLNRGDIEQELRHVLHSAEAAGQRILIEPARCKSCGFLFAETKLTKPSKCPECKGTRIFEPLVRIEFRQER